MYEKYNTHYFCSRCDIWHPHEVDIICPDCNHAMRSTPRNRKLRERFRVKYPELLHKGRNIK